MTYYINLLIGFHWKKELITAINTM